MKTYMKTILLFACGILLLGSCSKWTETESLPFEYATLESKNPQLYEAYLASVRAYHATEHQVLIAKFDNKEAIPSGRADHLTCLPDSVDFVILNNPLAINEVTLKEVGEIRDAKGIRTLVNVSYDAIASAFSAYVADETAALEAEFAALDEEAQAEQEEAYAEKIAALSAPEAFQENCAAAVADAIGQVAKVGADGINVIFNGVNPVSMTGSAQAAAAALQQPFFDAVDAWIGENPDGIVFFEGTPAYILAETEVVEAARYIIIPALSATNTVAFNYAVTLAQAASVPTDRFVIGVTAIDITDPVNTNGTFSEGTAIVGAANWAVTPVSGYTKAGVCVDHAQFDYFDITQVYSQINKAISIMNPSPVK